MKTNKEADNDWFRLESNKEGTKCVWGGAEVCVISVKVKPVLSAVVVLS